MTIYYQYLLSVCLQLYMWQSLFYMHSKLSMERTISAITERVHACMHPSLVYSNPFSVAET